MNINKIISFLIILTLFTAIGCLNDKNGTEDESSKYIEYTYFFEIYSNNSNYTVFLPVLMNYNNESMIQIKEFSNMVNISSVNIEMSTYGIGLNISSNKDVSFEKSGKILLSENNNFIESRFYLSLATNYFENIQKDYKNQGREFHIFKNGSKEIHLKMYLNTKLIDDKNSNVYEYWDKFEFDLDLTNGWNLYYSIKTGSGD